MTTPFLDAFFHHAQVRPDAWAWQAEDGTCQTYAQLAQAVIARVRAGVPAALNGVPGERVLIEDWDDGGWERFVWTAASQLLGMPSLALSNYQSSGRADELAALWSPHLTVKTPHQLTFEGPTRQRSLVERLTSFCLAVDLNHGLNTPEIGLVGEEEWTAHLLSLCSTAPLFPGDLVVMALPDTASSWLDVWASVLSQGALLRVVAMEDFPGLDHAWDWPSGAKHLHVSLAHALVLNRDTIPEDGHVWIHGPCPTWALALFPRAGHIDVPPVRRVLVREAEPKSPPDGLYEFALNVDPEAAWRKAKEQALIAVPGVVDALLAKHPLDPGKPRPIGVVVWETSPEADARIRRHVETVCAEDPELADRELVFLSQQFWRYHGIGDLQMSGCSLHFAEALANVIEHRKNGRP